MDKTELIRWMERNSAELYQNADEIWEHPETRFQEYFAVKRYSGYMQDKGFTVTERTGGLETAMTASFTRSAEVGAKAPVIAILGEYDALQGMSQKANVLRREPEEETADGHGCGHNLLGAASAYAAWAVKHWMEENGIPGTIRFYGCPAEEGGGGKGILARANVFDDVDAALSWHPSDYHTVTSGSSLANTELLFTFTGKSAHAASAPYLGRSALDAVELMDVGANYLREHIIPEARLHYAILDTGGTMPGIVQPHAKVLYTVRAPKTEEVQSIVKRLEKIAEGAALMTETSVSCERVKETADLIPNHTLEEALYRNMQLCPIPRPEEAELLYAEELQKTMPDFCSMDDIIKRCADPVERERLVLHRSDKIYSFLLPLLPFDTP